MATQVTNVYVKNINDTEWTELEKVFENDVLKFQKSPVKDAYYDYTRVAMVIIAISDGFYAVQNTSNYTIDVLFTNGAWTTFGPGQAQTHYININPTKVKIGDNPAVNFEANGINTWYNNNVPYKYHPAEYIRELYVDDSGKLISC